MDEPKDRLILCDTKPMIGSHTTTEFGLYDAEPFPVEGNAYYWYIRAVYWKRMANRKEGVQGTMEFVEKSHVVYDGPNPHFHLSSTDLYDVKNFIKVGQVINAIKRVREVTNSSLVDSKEYVDSLKNEVLGQWGNPKW